MTVEFEELAYHVGGLLYTPAVHEGIAEKMIGKSIPYLTSIAFCLEDAVLDTALKKPNSFLHSEMDLPMLETADIAIFRQNQSDFARTVLMQVMDAAS